MNNEPVAWIRSGDDQLSLVKGEDDGYMFWNPLYTRPANELQPYPTAKQYADALAEIEALKNIIANLTRINC